MKLHYSSTSPFTRKVLVCAMELGLADNIEKVPTNPWESAAEFVANNPLSRIPVLVTDDDLVLYDSPVICEYLDSLRNDIDLFPKSIPQRWLVLRLQALADGAGDAAVLRRMETQRPADEQSASWIDRQRNAVQRALDAMDQQADDWRDQLTIGQIAVGCLLGYLDLRFAEDYWRKGRDKLAAWFEEFEQRPSMKTTAPTT